MRGVCFACSREIELVPNPRGGAMYVLKRHGATEYSRWTCPCSETTHYLPARAAAPAKLPGVGKQGMAPCGHVGEHVTATMVVCPLGCPAPSAKPIDWACTHTKRWTFAGTESCVACGKIFKRS